MTPVMELIKTTQVVGLRQLLQLRKAQRLAWAGMMNGYYSTRVMQTMFNVGFFDEMLAHGSVDLREFAKDRDLDLDILQSLCDALFSFQILDKKDGRYTLTATGESLARVGRGWFDGVYGYQALMNDLEPLLRKQHEYGRDVKRRSDFIARGSGEVENWLYFPLAVDAIRRRGCTTVLDLGCGEGTFIRTLCTSLPNVHARGIDVAPEPIEEGRAKAAAAGLQDRTEFIVADISQIDRVPEPLRHVEIATVFFVLHELLFWGEQRVVDFLMAFRRLFPGVPLMIFELDRPTPEQMRKRPGMAVPYFLHHDLSQQRPAAKPVWLDVVKRAGFTKVDVRELKFARSIILTVE